jgi:hypothetical protein
MPRIVQSTLFGLKLLMKIVIHKFYVSREKGWQVPSIGQRHRLFGFLECSFLGSGIPAN